MSASNREELTRGRMLLGEMQTHPWEHSNQGVAAGDLLKMHRRRGTSELNRRYSNIGLGGGGVGECWAQGHTGVKDMIQMEREPRVLQERCGEGSEVLIDESEQSALQG